MTRKYFPNNWQEYKDAPEEMFIPHTFEEIMSWKVGQWELPSSVCCITRVMNTKTREVREYVFEDRRDAEKRLMKWLRDPGIELSVCDHNAIHHLYPEDSNDE